MLYDIYLNPPVFARDAFPWNLSSWHQAEIPGVNAIGTARLIARLYACLACGGELDGVRLLSREQVARSRRELSRGPDVLLDIPVAYGLGFELQTDFSAWVRPQTLSVIPGPGDPGVPHEVGS